MSFNIVLSNNLHRALEPGDLLCGIVKFKANAENYVESVTISLTGQTIVSLSQPSTTNSPYTQPSCGVLFRLHLILQGEPQLHRKGTQTWPFAFLVPSHAAFAPGGHFSAATKYFDCESPWRGSDDAETLPIPPSMSYKAGFSCSVHYGLHARLVRPPTAHLFGSRDLSVYKPVRLGQSSMVSNMPINMNGDPFQCIDRTLGEIKSWKFGLPRLPFMPGTRNEHKGSKFQDRSQKPSLRVSIPKILNTRCDLPVRMLLGSIPSDSGQCHDGVFLKSFCLDLMIHTRVRDELRQEMDNRSLILIRGSQQMEIPYLPKLTDSTLIAIFQCPDNENHHINTYLEVSDQNENSVCLEGEPMSAIITDIPPEFCTYNIFRSYSLRFQLQLRYGKTSTTISEQGIPITISDTQTSDASNEQIYHLDRDDGIDRRLPSVFEGQAFLPPTGTIEFEGPPPAYC